MPYQCPECGEVSRSWNNLRLHMIHKHDQKELTEAGQEAFLPYRVDNTAKPAPLPTEQVAELQEPVGEPRSPLEEVPPQPVERLEAILQLNGVPPDKVKRAVNVFRVNRQWWGDPYRVETLLTSHVTNKGELIQSLTDQYWSGVKLPEQIAILFTTPPRTAEEQPPTRTVNELGEGQNQAR